MTKEEIQQKEYELSIGLIEYFYYGEGKDKMFVTTVSNIDKLKLKEILDSLYDNKMIEKDVLDKIIKNVGSLLFPIIGIIHIPNLYFQFIKNSFKTKLKHEFELPKDVFPLTINHFKDSKQ